MSSQPTSIMMAVPISLRPRGRSNSLAFGNRVSIDLGTGAGAFAAPIVFGTGGSVNRIVVADFNEDHNLDLVLNTPDSNAVAILFGDGHGNFPSGTTINVGTRRDFGQFATTDFNGDGHADLAFPVQDGRNQVTIGTATDTAGSGPWLVLSTGSLSPTGLVAGDFNEDGKVDLAATAGNQIDVFLGSGAGNFTSTPLVFPLLPAGQVAGTLDVADFNGDGHLDLVAGNNSAATVAVLLGDGHGGLGAPNLFTVGLGFLGQRHPRGGPERRRASRYCGDHPLPGLPSS